MPTCRSPEVSEKPRQAPLNQTFQDGIDSAFHAALATRTHNNSFKPVADCIPGPNLRRLLVDLHVEGESVWLAA